MREPMETRCVLLKLCVWVALLTITAGSQNCRYKFLHQPPSELDCDPMGIFLALWCSTESASNIVIWYWTQNVCEAGINGTAILPGDTSDNYRVSSFGTNNRHIGFTVSESTLGYYWCEISNAVNVSLRPSTITHVLQPTNMSLPACTNALVISSHNDNPECAEKDSPTVISRPPLPSSCVSPQPTSSFSTTPTISVDLQTSTAPTPTSVPSTSQNCPSGYKFSIQPPSELNCNPVGRSLILQCSTLSSSDNVTWYWTQNVRDAGINGTAILPGNTSDYYDVNSYFTNNRQIGFTVNESTIGYYWCEISNAVNVALRSSTITPVCLPTNITHNCTRDHVQYSLHNNIPECAEKDSPTVISRPPLPSSCSVSPQLTSSFSATPTISVDLQTSTAPISKLVPSVVSSARLQTFLDSSSSGFSVPNTASIASHSSPSSVIPSAASSAGLQSLLDLTSTRVETVSIPPTISLPETSTVAIAASAAQFPVSSSAEILSATNNQRLQTLMDSTSTSTVTVAVPPTTSSLGLQTLLHSTSTSKIAISVTPTLSTASLSSPSSLVPSLTSPAGLHILLDSTPTVSLSPETSSPSNSTVTFVVIAVAVFNVLSALGLVLLLIMVIWSCRRRITKNSKRSTSSTPQNSSTGEDDSDMLEDGVYEPIPGLQDNKPSRYVYYYERVNR